jgi:hypothetical protein
MRTRRSPAASSLLTAVLAAVMATPLAAAGQVAGARAGDLRRGLVAAYELDGGAVNAVTGAVAQAFGAVPAEGRDGRPRGALRFDGVRAHLDLGEGIAPDRFTVAAWIRPDDVGRTGVIVSRLRNTPGHFHRNLELRVNPGGRVFLHVPGGRDWDFLETRAAVSPGTWTHVAATYDGRFARIFLNGVPDGPPLDVAYAQSRGPTFVGARPDEGGRGPIFFFAGAIDDVRIWDRALDEGEVRRVAEPPRPPGPPGYPPPAPAPYGGAEPLAHYPLDGDARDAYGRAHGTVSGARSVEDRHGDPRGALGFAGKEHADLGVRLEPETFTLSAWIRPLRASRDEAVFSKWSSTAGPRDRWLELRVSSSNRLELELPSDRGPRVLRGNARLEPARWVHVAATFDGDRAVLWVDGRRDAEDRLAPFEGSRGPVFLGARPDASGRRPRLGTGFEGRMDDVRVFRGALPAAEVERLAAPGRPRPPAPPRDDDEGDDLLLVRVGKLLVRYDAAAARRDAGRILRVEERALETLAEAEREARRERGGGPLANQLRRVAGELERARGAVDALSLDRKRSALAGLAESLWNDLAEELDREPVREDPRDPYGRDAAPPAPGAGWE